MFRRFLAVWCLPLLLAILPAAASFAVLASLPSAARDFYLESITRLDQLILAFGSFLLSCRLSLLGALSLGKTMASMNALILGSVIFLKLQSGSPFWDY